MTLFVFNKSKIIIILLLSCSPDQNPKVICEYVRESLAGRNAPLHTVAYDCSISATNVSVNFVTQAEHNYKDKSSCKLSDIEV